MQQVIERWKGHIGETEIHIGVTELLGFLAVAMPNELGGSRYKNWWGQV